MSISRRCSAGAPEYKLHPLNSRCCFQHRIDSLRPNSCAAALFPLPSARSIVFNFKAASYAFLCLCHDEGDKMTTVIRMMGSLSACENVKNPGEQEDIFGRGCVWRGGGSIDVEFMEFIEF